MNNLEQKTEYLSQKLREWLQKHFGNKDVTQYKNLALSLIFYKFLSNQFQQFANENLNGEIEYSSLDEYQHQDLMIALKEEAKDSLGYFVAPKYLIGSFAQAYSNNNEHYFLEEFDKAIIQFQQNLTDQSKDVFNGLLSDLDTTSALLGSSATARNQALGSILVDLNVIEFYSKDKPEILGSAFFSLIELMAMSLGKKKGDFYTPAHVSELMASIIHTEKNRVRNLYDPTFGSGSLLIKTDQTLDFVDKIYGQDLIDGNLKTARMNFLINGYHYSKLKLESDDTLEKPKHTDLKFDVIVCNPKFSQTWNNNEAKKHDPRFANYGKLAPKSKADLVFIQHIIYSLEDDGIAVVLIPHGVLFRGDSEGTIRKFLLERLNCIDAVIGLAKNLSPVIDTEVAMLVLKKNRQADDKILFINAKEFHEKQKAFNIISPEQIAEITEIYKTKKTIPKISEYVERSKIVEHGYNLNIPRYIDLFEPEPEVDIDDVAFKLEQIDENLEQIDLDIRRFCDELSVRYPFKI
ncbi:type I restriction-modification system subunit M [Acinetobacter bereziniae]|uniref:type I restriction-modification system subunit M n=1 Tax=Acinetobacter bereziniae TaxID=106648 RepID=UPI00124F8118|nr:type I restriction-modification system subunit M [Acinetobacter bereziniae]MBJ9906694.1 type I restriction-modification system subunit M [Acinetobacter bereziniae]MBJ9928196.1 type I restriction-modification system subunit M [Acinetobacter bereziniae]MDG3556307.1 type I restriction-modification system subunit M [Acinetobacter bereziniae]MDP6002952.1 type I restriction-modification system subunit M [Acinetobacter bereziniae]QQC79657.1 type I restriction-modification system subunit M [Acineto